VANSYKLQARNKYKKDEEVEEARSKEEDERKEDTSSLPLTYCFFSS
jgi:hypothetical protein